MYCVRKIIDDIYWVGGNDRKTSLFENIFPIKRGVSYNSYLIMDEKTVLLDTVDYSIGRQFIENVTYVLGGRSLDYIVVNHMEPDHCSLLGDLLLRYPNLKIIGNSKTFQMIDQFFGETDVETIVVKEGDTFNTGRHNLNFIMAPMVHWPEAMVTFDDVTGTLFSADAFGTFGAFNGSIFADEMDFDRDWLDDARRYYTNIVGKYGSQVQSLLKKASTIDIKYICPLHGPIWRDNIGYFIDKYDKWSKYVPEKQGVLIIYASMYGNTENMANVLANTLSEKGVKNIKVYDVSNTHISKLIAESFKFSNIVLASPTYNSGIYPLMENYIADMKALNLQNRTIAVMDNGTWASTAGKQIVKEVSEMKNMRVIDKVFSIKSAMNKEQMEDFDDFANKIIESM